MKNCSSVPDDWNVGQFWVNVHGKCLQFFEGRVCSGRSLQLQPSSSSTIFRWNFPDYNIRSVSLCEGVPPSSSSSSAGNNHHIEGSGDNNSNIGSGSRPIGGPSQGGSSIVGAGSSGNGNWQQGGLIPSSPSNPGSSSSSMEDG